MVSHLTGPLVALIALASLAAPRLDANAPTDLDALMEQVVARRDENWKKLRQYVLDERETFTLTGPDETRLYGFRREYTWFIRDGVFVRSPVRANGVEIGEAERRKYEDSWIATEERRRKRSRAGHGREAPPAETTAPAADASAFAAELNPALEPRFVSAAYFLRFKFEPHHYALVGRERLFDRDVLRIEYYPEKLFREGRARPNERLRDRDDEIEEKMNKVSLITLWVDPEARQILRYTFDDIDMNFLPGRSLVRVEDAKAEMQMHQPFPDVWLPRSIAIRFRMMLAAGPVDARYDVEYHDYRLADVKARIKP